MPKPECRRMSTGNFWAIVASIVLCFLGGCGVILSGVSGGIPELAYGAIPMLVIGVAIFWRVVKRYPKPTPP